jgi:hypothetical protein
MDGTPSARAVSRIQRHGQPVAASEFLGPNTTGATLVEGFIAVLPQKRRVTQ